MLAARKKMMGFAPNISRNISLFFSDPSMGGKLLEETVVSPLKEEEEEEEKERRDFDRRYRFAL